MISIPLGSWSIESVIVNGTTVVNDDSIRGLEIHEDGWVIQPSNQRFRLRESNGSTAVLESGGQLYYADVDVNADRLSLKMSRPKIEETVTIDAVAVTASVYSSN